MFEKADGTPVFLVQNSDGVLEIFDEDGKIENYL